MHGRCSPYVLPGPVDTWGRRPTSGWHTHQLNIDFGVDRLPESGDWTLVVNLLDYAKGVPAAGQGQHQRAGL